MLEYKNGAKQLHNYLSQNIYKTITKQLQNYWLQNRTKLLHNRYKPVKKLLRNRYKLPPNCYHNGPFRSTLSTLWYYVRVLAWCRTTKKYESCRQNLRAVCQPPHPPTKANQWINQSTKSNCYYIELVNQLFNQLFNQSTSQWTNGWPKEGFNESINQSIKQSNQSNQYFNQPTSQ